MVEQAHASKAAIQRLADRICAVFVPCMLACGAATLAGWLLAGSPAEHAVSAALAVLIIACPCALGLATPGRTGSGLRTRRAARRVHQGLPGGGILPRRGHGGAREERHRHQRADDAHRCADSARQEPRRAAGPRGHGRARLRVPSRVGILHGGLPGRTNRARGRRVGGAARPWRQRPGGRVRGAKRSRECCSASAVWTCPQTSPGGARTRNATAHHRPGQLGRRSPRCAGSRRHGQPVGRRGGRETASARAAAITGGKRPAWWSPGYSDDSGSALVREPSARAFASSSLNGNIKIARAVGCARTRRACSSSARSEAGRQFGDRAVHVEGVVTRQRDGTSGSPRPRDHLAGLREHHGAAGAGSSTGGGAGRWRRR